MLRRLAPLLALLMLVAWGPEGHEVVCTIAQQTLNDDAEKAVKDLLGEGTLASVAYWADDAKFTAPYAYTRPYHYADMPKGEDELDLSRDCPEKGCVVRAINDHAAVLADNKVRLGRN
jgi:hypothetical protein